MRVLQIAHDAVPFSMGGVEVYVDRVSRALSRAGVEVEILAAVEPGRWNTYRLESREVDGLRLSTLAHRTGRDRAHLLRVARDLSAFDRNPRVEERVRSVVRARRPDVVHVHHLVHLSSALLGALEADGVPVVVTLHDYWWLCVAGQLLNEDGPHEPEECSGACFRYLLHNPHKDLGLLRRAMARVAGALDASFGRFVQERQARMVREINKARLVIAPSRDLSRRYVRAGVDASRIVVSDYGTETAGIERRLRRRGAGPLRFGFVGRLVPEKGPHLLIEAFERLAAGDAATLTVHGAPAKNPGYESALRALASSGRVAFAGPFRNEDVGRILDGLDVLVVPSTWWENSPLVIHEAFAAGMPVIAARAGGMAELVRDGVDGLLFRIGDAGDLARALARALEPGVLDALSRGTPAVKTLDENVSELLTLYGRVTDRREARAS